MSGDHDTEIEILIDENGVPVSMGVVPVGTAVEALECLHARVCQFVKHIRTEAAEQAPEQSWEDAITAEFQYLFENGPREYIAYLARLYEVPPA